MEKTKEFVAERDEDVIELGDAIAETEGPDGGVTELEMFQPES